MVESKSNLGMIRVMSAALGVCSAGGGLFYIYFNITVAARTEGL